MFTNFNMTKKEKEKADAAAERRAIAAESKRIERERAEEEAAELLRVKTQIKAEKAAAKLASSEEKKPSLGVRQGNFVLEHPLHSLKMKGANNL